jgi:hypothetical protein
MKVNTGKLILSIELYEFFVISYGCNTRKILFDGRKKKENPAHIKAAGFSKI